MKKIILTVCLVAVLVVSSLGGLSAFALVSMEECDKCFQATMNAMLDKSEVDGNSIAALRKPVYDITLEQLGFVYEYTLANGVGYAIIICDDGNYAAVEVVPDSQSPYAEVGEEEQCVYVNNMSYLKAVDGILYDIESDFEISEESYAVLSENAILYTNSDIIVPEYVTVVVPFQGEPQEEVFYMNLTTPQYYCAGLGGGCAAIAGGNILGYFDRYYEDLIPSHAAGEYLYGEFFYDFEDSYVRQVIQTLYTDMQGDGIGITEANCISGLKKYCSRIGYTCTFTSVMTSGKINYSLVKTSMRANKPVMLFLNTYNICDLHFGSDKDTHYYSLFSGNHVMVGFGFRDTTYTLSSGSKSNYRFIYVSVGFVTPRDAYFNIDYSTNIVSAYGVHIG